MGRGTLEGKEEQDGRAGGSFSFPMAVWEPQTSGCPPGMSFQVEGEGDCSML